MERINIPSETLIEVWQDNVQPEIPDELLHNESLEFKVNKDFSVIYDNEKLTLGIVEEIREKEGVIDIDFEGITLVINNK